MTTSIRLDFDSMSQRSAERLALIIEGFVNGKFPMACLHGSVIETESNAPVSDPVAALLPGQLVKGMGVTMHVGSDRYAATVTSFSASQKTLFFIRDNYKRVDNNGYGGEQEYEYGSVPVTEHVDPVSGTKQTNESMARWNAKRKRYIVSGTTSALTLGRNTHFDPSF